MKDIEFKRKLALDLFFAVRRFVTRHATQAAEVSFMPCEVAQAYSMESPRTVCHTGHVKGAVCYAETFLEFGREIQVAIILHEFGHLFGGKAECVADRWVKQALGVTINYTAAPESIEIVSMADYTKVMKG